MCSAISFTAEQESAINEILEARLENPSYDIWGCEAAGALRKAIKDFGIKSQSNFCCYCMEKNHSDSHKAWEVEHILPLSDYAQFAFEPLNLAISCPDCNTAKSNKKVSNTKARKNLPSQTTSYFIVHPHFDSYEEHVKKSGILFYPKSSKGRKTIEICGLLRFAEKYVDWANLEKVEKIEAEAKAIQSKGGDKDRIRRMISDLSSLL